MKTKTVKFQIGRGKNKQWYWRFRAGNGEIIAQGEGYKQQRSALRVLEILRAAFDNNEVKMESLDASGRPFPETKYLGTLVTPRDKK